jgi:hypothetical protein
MFDDIGGCLTQNRIDVRLVQNNVYCNKPVWGSDLQLLLLPAQNTSRVATTQNGQTTHIGTHSESQGIWLFPPNQAGGGSN